MQAFHDVGMDGVNAKADSSTFGECAAAAPCRMGEEQKEDAGSVEHSSKNQFLLVEWCSAVALEEDDFHPMQKQTATDQKASGCRFPGDFVFCEIGPSMIKKVERKGPA